MNTSTSTGTVQAVIQADLEYAKVGGTSLRLDLYTPSGAPSGLPTLLYLHGGAWALGDKSDAAVERLMPIVANGFAVASANYRLVPSVTYPAPIHDVKAAVRWLRANAGDLGSRSRPGSRWAAPRPAGTSRRSPRSPRATRRSRATSATTSASPAPSAPWSPTSRAATSCSRAGATRWRR